MAKSLTILQPDDWHLHLRDGELMRSVVGDTARVFARAIVMPNLKPPVVTAALAVAYRERILAALPEDSRFEPLMTLYLTDNMAVSEIGRAVTAGVKAVKYYPAGATTNSDSGVTDIRKCDAVLGAMQSAGLPLLVHGEVTDPEIDVFDREAAFLDRELAGIVERFPALKVVVEHITTSEAAAFVEGARAGVAATITPHHLLLNRNAIFQGGIRPHHYCLPVLKREGHREALVRAAISGSARFFLGTDSAPHAKGSKESCCGAAGIYSAHSAIEFYAEVFDTAGALDKLEGFASHYGADFYGLPRNTARITLVREAQDVPKELAFGAETLVPLRAGERLRWRVAG